MTWSVVRQDPRVTKPLPVASNFVTESAARAWVRKNGLTNVQVVEG